MNSLQKKLGKAIGLIATILEEVEDELIVNEQSKRSWGRKWIERRH